jgi:20S proteasome alpha/beta subunit
LIKIYPSLPSRNKSKPDQERKKKMECVFGLVGDGFVIVASDTSAVNSILVHKTNEDKIMKLDSHKLVAASGESGDRFVTCPLQNVSLLINDYSFFWLIFFLGFVFSEFNSRSIYRRTWLCISFVMGFL